MSKREPIFPQLERLSGDRGKGYRGGRRGRANTWYLVPVDKMIEAQDAPYLTDEKEEKDE